MNGFRMERLKILRVCMEVLRANHATASFLEKNTWKLRRFFLKRFRRDRYVYC